jgi:hypothetical protein
MCSIIRRKMYNGCTYPYVKYIMSPPILVYFVGLNLSVFLLFEVVVKMSVYIMISETSEVFIEPYANEADNAKLRSYQYFICSSPCIFYNC